MSLTRFISKRSISKFISTARHFSSSSTKPILSSSFFPKKKPFFITSPGKQFPRLAHSSALQDDGPTSERETNMDEFLSRFVWIMRKKLVSAYPGCDKETIDGMLVVIVEKVVLEMERGKGNVGGVKNAEESGDFSPDLWRTVWEVSNEVMSDMGKEKKKEKMKGFLQSEEVKEMYRFAGEIGIRGDLLRELRFKWAREKMEESEFYVGLERLAKDENKEKGTDGVGNDVGGEEKSVSLPKRHGKVKYKIYGLNLSDEKWGEVADKIHESGKVMWPEEAKPVTGKCKLVMEKIMALKGEDDYGLLLEEWKALLKPSRIEWIALLDKLKEQGSHLYLKIAEHVLDEESFETKVHDYSRLIDAHARENHLEDAERIQKKMKENSISSDVVTLTSLLHMYCKSENFEKAKEIYDSLKNSGLEPDVKLFNSLIMASVNAGDPNYAHDLINEMEKRDMKPTQELYMAVIRSFSQQGNFAATSRVSGQMQMAGFQHTLESFTLIIEACVQNENGSIQAGSHFEHMISSGHKPDDRCVAGMISVYEHENKLANALNLLLGLEKEGFSPGVRTYTNLVDWFAKMGMVDEVEQMLDKIAKLGEVPPLKLHISLCDMYSKMGSEKKALQALGVLESKSQHLSNMEFDRLIMSLVAGGFVQDGKRMVKLMEDRGFKPSENVRMALVLRPQGLKSASGKVRRYGL